YIPSRVPFNFYTPDYEKGLELYSSGVLIMEKCPDLLPDHFSFVKGVVDSEDLSLNISREMLQHDRQLKLIANRIESRIKDELKSLLENDREKYEEFYENFGQQLKYGVYDKYGANKDLLKDLLLFYSSKERKLVTLAEYVSRMPDDQKYIYYASGESIEQIDRLPQTELIKDRDYEILYFEDDIDEFAIRMLGEYEDKEFRSVSSGDLGLETDEETEAIEKEMEESKGLFKEMKKVLKERVAKVKPSKRLKNHPVCLSSDGDISIEMEKVLKAMPNNPDIKAEKILEININHQIYEKLKAAYENDKEKFKLYTKLLYDQALLIEGLNVEDPVEFTNNICKLM
ncbi:MAG TPA: molecular chaperone HtpG, partial [Tissierellaceae bacterium]|nr:molecular chaperone HtpG [Tissierellaceae bacterium]